MTPNQIERIQNKIKKIKRVLASEKKLLGCYDDSRGLRYLPPTLYIQLQDYKGAMRYFNWFNKNFNDDVGYPIFLFEWSITLFKNNKIKEAEKMVLRTFFSNTFIIDKFLGKEYLELGIQEYSNWENRELGDSLFYQHKMPELHDFSLWLSTFVQSAIFYKYANEYFDIKRRLMNEPVGKNRTELVQRKFQILNNY